MILSIFIFNGYLNSNFVFLSRFTLGTRAVANHYYQQFKEIFTEEGRKNVVIKHVVPGQLPRTCTPVMQRVHQQVCGPFFSASLFLFIHYASYSTVSGCIPLGATGESGAIGSSTVAADSDPTCSTAGKFYKFIGSSLSQVAQSLVQIESLALKQNT